MVSATWCIEFSEQVLAVFTENAQLTRAHTESVGQLFTPDTSTDVVKVTFATVLKPKHAGRTGVSFDIHSANAERKRLFEQGLHCIGFWHTHPESHPTPSGPDAALARDHAKAAKANLNALAFIIVGNGRLEESLYVSVHDGENFHRCVLLNATQTATITKPAHNPN
ncbi:hypothetical protein GCM10010970_22740 [Silvimonas iriomotensis]|uniref:JAB domain-containing protein n=2 Tax=Silvimonas iriomotensis TaxID=449662 RepID=A0ABQ2PAJ8_9NEIS|nr:hypothetical protein GCM10010970_22740 [Silvimonas iriomotensis]